MYSKVIAVKNQSRKNNMSVPLLLISGVFSFACLVFQGCASTQVAVRPIVAPIIINTESYTTEPRYISPEAQWYLLSRGVTLGGLGEENTIMEVHGEVLNIRSLCRSRATSFTTAQMPKDMERILKKYKTDDEYGDFYNYVMANLQRVVLCPDISYLYLTTGNTLYGMILPEVEIFPGENTVYVNALYTMRYRDSVARLLSTIIHEAGHLYIANSVKSGKISFFYLSKNLDERHSLILQVNFLKAAAQDSEFYADRTLLNWYIAWHEERIVDYNLELGLSPDDRTLFPR
jgi:ABC-type uncharacterized transport system permease subunit